MQVINDYNVRNNSSTVAFDYTIGMVMSTPRSCIRAETFSPLVDTIAFNTRDLTGNVFGCDYKDSRKLFSNYAHSGIYQVSSKELIR